MFDLGCSTVKVIFTFCGNPRTRLCRRLPVRTRSGQPPDWPDQNVEALAVPNPRLIDHTGAGLGLEPEGGRPRWRWEHLAGRFVAKSLQVLADLVAVHAGPLQDPLLDLDQGPGPQPAQCAGMPRSASSSTPSTSSLTRSRRSSRASAAQGSKVVTRTVWTWV